MQAPSQQHEPLNHLNIILNITLQFLEYEEMSWEIIWDEHECF